MNAHREERGFSLIEILITSSVLITVVTGMVGALQLYMRLAAGDRDKAQAASLTQEASEALQLMRDIDWTDIEALQEDTAYQLYWSGSVYTATTTDILLNDKYVRTFTLSTLYRDGNDNVAESGTEDENGRRVLIEVFASSTPSAIMTAELLLLNLYAPQ
ncbi:MAG TPA: type II secretion system protein [Candidatus Paceibacterota bacterium]